MSGTGERARFYEESSEAVCRSLVEFFRESGRLLWVGGYIIGSDRVSGESPFGFGSDSTVGLGIVAQLAGELTGGAVALLRSDNLYGAAALCRQLVEVEYLAWAFAEDESEARHWLRASREERLKLWSPARLRERSAGRFRAADYWRHCELGGHPTPQAGRLLPDHNRTPAAVWWSDLATHAESVHRYLIAAIERYKWSEQVAELESAAAARLAVRSWHDRHTVIAASD